MLHDQVSLVGKKGRDILYISKTGEFIQYYWNELCPKTRAKAPTNDELFTLSHPTCKLAKCIVEDFDEQTALELGKILVSLYNK